MTVRRWRLQAGWPALFLAAWGAAPAGGQEPRGERSESEVEAVLARAAEELAGGRAAEAEDLLREELRDGRAPALLIGLADVLVWRSGELDATSDLGQSLRHGVLEEALEVYEEAARSPGWEAVATVGAAGCHALLERPEAAETMLRSTLGALRAGGADAAPRQVLVREISRFLAAAGRADDAQQAIDEALAAGEFDQGGARLEELRIAAIRRDPERALALSIAAVEAGADSYLAAYLAWESVGEGGLETLLNLYSRLLERWPDDLAPRFYRGVVRYHLGDGAGAAEDLDPCVDSPRFGDRARLNLGLALLRANRGEEARAHFERLLDGESELQGKARDGLIGVAVSRARSRRFDEALEIYRRVLSGDPANRWARIGAPLCLRSLGRHEDAAAAYEEGLRVFPEEPQLLNDYALFLKARGERARAKELFERALSAGHGTPERQSAAADGGENLGIVAYRDERDLTAAARYFARTLLLDPDRPRVRFYRELCLCDGMQ